MGSGGGYGHLFSPDIVQAKVKKLLHSSQFGIGVVAGAESMIMVCKALAKLSPDDAFAALDMVNAFGEISRVEILEEVIDAIPELAPFLLQLWGESGTPIYTSVGPCAWEKIVLVDGLFQRHNLSSLLFCLGLKRALKRFELNNSESVFHCEYIDDLLLKFRPHLAETIMPKLESALATVNLRLNQSKCKVLIPSVLVAERDNEYLVKVGLPQVFGGMELLGGAMEGEYTAPMNSVSVHEPPEASLKRVEAVEMLSQQLINLFSTPLSRSSHRVAWTMIDKVLNKALDYDARILHPECFSIIATRLDHAVEEVVLKVLHVTELSVVEKKSIELGITRGGCGLTTGSTKAIFAHVAACCQVLPSVAQYLVDQGWSQEQVQSSIDVAGLQCGLDKLRESGIFIRVDGTLSPSIPLDGGININTILWGQARKLYATLLNSLEERKEQQLREVLAHDERQLARLNSSSGPIAGKWLGMFPQSWWPEFEDSSFIMALRFRCGMQVSVPGQTCKHAKVKDRLEICEQCMDQYGDHAISCCYGGHLFTRHGAINNVIADAGRVAGYTAYCEQVVPELSQVMVLSTGMVKIKEARIDVELFGHAYAPSHLIDGTIKHPAAASYLR